MSKEPKLMNFSRMRDIFEPHIQQIREHIYIDNELAIVHGDPRVFQLIVQQKPPFSIDDYRLGLIAKGEIKGNINLVEKHITAGTLVFIGPGSIICPISFSPDLEIYGMGLSVHFPMPFAPGQLPSAFNGQVRDFQLSVSNADMETARGIIETLWHIVHLPDYNRQTVSSLVAAQMHHYNGLYSQYTMQRQDTLSREQTIFDRFIYLVNQSATREHQLRYYADKMCLTERYLGTVVRQASGTTAKEWIDRAIITRIKVELKHTDKSVARISEEMNFPNPSFFSKYFKRLTSMTPAEFRLS
ncbi:MAG: AraC family transcriptional regulator [Prevotella sp.]|nr:AraC family transcriptional regulator [Prevotella sp.]MBR1448310.1 AraC family transcriptional regulator [Prevotella sp.]